MKLSNRYKKLSKYRTRTVYMIEYITKLSSMEGFGWLVKASSQKQALKVLHNFLKTSDDYPSHIPTSCLDISVLLKSKEAKMCDRARVITEYEF